MSYNQEAYIRQAIESVVLQDYPDLEVVVGDDGSTDGTVRVAQDMAKAFPGRVRLVDDRRHLGITGNSNRTLAACRGDYVAMMAADDLSAPRRIGRLMQWFDQNPDGVMVASDVEVFDDSDAEARFLYRNPELSRRPGVRALIRQGNQPPSSSFMFARWRCPDVWYDDRTPVVSDWLFWIKVAMHGRVGYIPEPLFLYRRHPANSTAAGLDRAYLDDRLIYTDILIADHPEWAWSAKVQRGHIHYHYAVRAYKEGEYRLAKRHFALSVAERPFQLRAYAGLGAALASRPGRGLVQRFWPLARRMRRGVHRSKESGAHVATPGARRPAQPGPRRHTGPQTVRRRP